MKAFILAIFLVLATATAVMAKPGSETFGSQLSAAQCDPGTNKMVLNIVFQVAGDADSGVAGYWAYDSYMKHVQAWDMGSGTYCVQVKYTGSFVTVEGSSPAGGTGTVGAGVTGTMDGGYTGIVSNGVFISTKRTKGNIGSKEYQCIITAGDVGNSCQYYDWVSEYFGSTATLTKSFWGWTYRAGANGTWVNADASVGNSGDITGEP